MAMIAMTTRSSIKVKAQAWLGDAKLFEPLKGDETFAFTSRTFAPFGTSGKANSAFVFRLTTDGTG
jgi:hypothetical protein